jgi:hypothetical protein
MYIDKSSNKICVCNYVLIFFANELYMNKTFYEALSRWGYENIDLFGLLAIGIRILNYYKNIQMYNAISRTSPIFYWYGTV